MRSWIPRVPPLRPVRVAASAVTRAAARSVSASASASHKPAAKDKDAAARHSSSSGASAVPVTTATKGGGSAGGKAEKESRRVGGSERAGHSSSLTSASSSSSPASSSSSSGRGGRPRHLLPAELNSLLSWPREFFANPLELLSLPSRVLRDGPLAALRGLPSSVELPESWVPTVDVREDDKAIEIHSELAGIKPDDIHLSVKDGHLTLQGERKHVSRDDTGRVHRLERSYGTFLRRFTLPEGTDANAIKADLMEGVLRIHIPKHTPNNDESDGVRVPIEKRGHESAEATASAPSSAPSTSTTSSQPSAIAPPVSASLTSAALSAAANATPPSNATSTSSSPSSSSSPMQSSAKSTPTPTPAWTDGSARGDDSDGDPDDRGDPATVATARPVEGKSTPLSEPAAPGRGGETLISV